MPTKGSALRVLLAGGSLDFQAVVKRWLVRQSCVATVHTAATGVETLTRCERGESDLLLIDAQLPDIDGFELTRRIKERPAAPLVVILVLFDYAAVQQEAAAAGADGLIDKTTFIQQLGPILPDLVRRQAARRGDAPGP